MNKHASEPPERCFQCDAETGRAGKDDDSIYFKGLGPFCSKCHGALLSYWMRWKPWGSLVRSQGEDMKIRSCKDCRFVKPGCWSLFWIGLNNRWRYAECHHPKSLTTEVDNSIAHLGVEAQTTEYNSCQTMRRNRLFPENDEKRCGREAKFFEPKN